MIGAPARLEYAGKPALKYPNLPECAETFCCCRLV